MIDTQALSEVMQDLHEDQGEKVMRRLTAVSHPESSMKEHLDAPLSATLRVLTGVLDSLPPSDDIRELAGLILRSGLLAAMEMGFVFGQEYGRRGFNI